MLYTGLYRDLDVKIMSMSRSLAVLLVLIEFISPSDSLRNDTVNPSLDPSISWFLKYTPFFDLTKIPQISEQCRNDFQTFLTAMDNLELWALKSEKELLNK